MALKTIRPGIRFLVFLFLAAAFSCEEQGWFADCNDCTPTEPASEYLVKKFTRAQPVAILNIYEGELEDGVLLNSASPGSDTYNIAVRLNKKYPATATYEMDGKTYTAVDSAFPRTKFTETQCTDPCWYVYDNELDLRIKYTAD